MKKILFCVAALLYSASAFPGEWHLSLGVGVNFNDEAATGSYSCVQCRQLELKPLKDPLALIELGYTGKTTVLDADEWFGKWVHVSSIVDQRDGSFDGGFVGLTWKW